MSALQGLSRQAVDAITHTATAAKKALSGSKVDPRTERPADVLRDVETLLNEEEPAAKPLDKAARKPDTAATPTKAAQPSAQSAIQAAAATPEQAGDVAAGRGHGDDENAEYNDAHFWRPSLQVPLEPLDDPEPPAVRAFLVNPTPVVEEEPETPSSSVATKDAAAAASAAPADPENGDTPLTKEQKPYSDAKFWQTTLPVRMEDLEEL